MMSLSSAETIRASLHNALGKIESFKSCALLDYPDHPNIGDHLIWLGGVIYLTNVMKTQIKYTCSLHNFSPKTLEDNIGKSPIVFHGGGNLGDLWTEQQKFREGIISKYRDRPIVILPQSLYFRHEVNLIKTANIFNSHPSLTIFLRDERSYKIAREAFDKCQVFKAPDMAFQMTDLQDIFHIQNTKSSILYLSRKDREINQKQSENIFDLPNLVVEDWIAYEWKFGHPTKKLAKYVSTLYREVWQRGLATPIEWNSRQKWQNSYPYEVDFNHVYQPSIHQLSWSLMHSGVYQLKQHRLVITNRLHGHIICVLFNIPHVFLPNSYYKNEAFYEEWTKEIPDCRFIKDTSEVKIAVQELLASSTGKAIN
ncbi:polysaccharide pyruvyl transferase family protein [Anabaena sp. CCY 9910]|uniref:polysaccharide pyruvyl transferase family protein n=1 Tax=Anabaena sp. CCY 9910 TaxID=3103870 RepID=UPI0039DF379A